MNKAIKLAIEKGGYKYGHGVDGDYETDGWSYQEIIDEARDKVILDPLFWQALGKALGWREKKTGLLFRDLPEQANTIESCLPYAHLYFDLILTGGDTEKFWKDLLNNQ